MDGGSDKATLRTEVLRRRAAVPQHIRDRFAKSLTDDGADCVRRLVTVKPPVIAVFLPIRGEPDTAPLIDALAAFGSTVALPATIERARPLRFQAWRPGDALTVGRYGVREPLPSARDVSPDLLFVPLAAFDRRGFRLGYGAGYYDSSIEALRRHKPVTAIGVAFATQEVETVPTEPHDQRLDAVITERGLMLFGPA